MKTILLLLALFLLTSCTAGGPPTETQKNPTEVETITVAASCRIPPRITEAVKEFNSAHTDVRIQVNDYHTKYYQESDPAAAVNRLALDISTGLLEPDVVMEMRSGEENATSYLVKNNLYTDLMPLIDEEIFSCVARSFTEEEKMWGITDSFYVNTILINSSTLEEGFLQNDEIPAGEMKEFTETLLEKGSWTVDEMLTYLSSLPEDVEFMKYLTQSNPLHTYVYPTYIDIPLGECYFESDSFLNYLTYMKTLPQKVTPTNAGIYADYRQGKVAALLYDMQGIINYCGMDAVFANPALPIGCPTQGEELAEIAYDHTYLVTSYSENTAEAWEFLKNVLTSVETENISTFPTMKSVFAKQCEFAKTCAFGHDIHGGNSIFPLEDRALVEQEGYDTIVTEFTDEDAAALEDFLETKVGLPRAKALPDTVNSILSEEITSYLAGKSSAEECANRIQSRVSLWLSERS